MTFYLINKKDGFIVEKPKEYLTTPEWEEHDLSFEEYQSRLRKYFSKGEAKPKVTQTGIRIDHYLENAKIFYDTQPYFYDKTGMWWLWNVDKWEIYDDVDIERKLDTNLGFLGQSITAGIRNNHLRAMMWYGREKMPMDAPLKWIQFKDKAYSLKSNKIYKVTKDYFFTNPIPWEIGESTETPVMDKLFAEWVGPENIQILYEIIAYCVYRDYPIHRIFFLLGDGCNGKTSYLQLLAKFIGKENICSTELDNIVGHNSSRFETMKMYKKLACLMGETNLNAMSKTSMLKKLSGHDLIGYEVKGKQPFDDYNYAKLIIASNGLPVTNDTTDGFSRRCLTIDFPNKFKEGQDILKTIPDVEYSNLAKKIMGILSELISKGAFTNEGTIEERSKKYTMASNPLPIFISKYCNVEVSLFNRYGELYQHYIQWLKFEKKRQVTKKEFTKYLNEEGYEVRKTSKEGEVDYYVEGLKFFPDFPDFQKSAVRKSNIRGDSKKLEIEEIKEISMVFNDLSIVNTKCNIEGCNETECNFDDYNVPYCRKHL